MSRKGTVKKRLLQDWGDLQAIGQWPVNCRPPPFVGHLRSCPRFILWAATWLACIDFTL